jgi:hypothetical protein
VSNLDITMFEVCELRITNKNVLIDGLLCGSVIEIAVLSGDATRCIVQKKDLRTFWGTNMKLACVASNTIKAKGEYFRKAVKV